MLYSLICAFKFVYGELIITNQLTIVAPTVVLRYLG